MFVKRNYADEDVNDVTIDNSILDKTSSVKVVGEIFKASLTRLYHFSLAFMLEIVALLVVGSYGSLTELLAVQLGIIYSNFFCGGLFLKGCVILFEDLNRKNKDNKKIKSYRQNSFKCIYILFAISAVLPVIVVKWVGQLVGLPSDLVSPMGTYVRYSSAGIILLQIFSLNDRTIFLTQKSSSSAIFTVLGIAFHALVSTALSTLLNNSVMAVAITYTATTAVLAIISAIFLNRLPLSVSKKAKSTRKTLTDFLRESSFFGFVEILQCFYVLIIVGVSIAENKASLIATVFLINLVQLVNVLSESLSSTIPSQIAIYAQSPSKYFKSFFSVFTVFLVGSAVISIVLRFSFSSIFPDPAVYSKVNRVLNYYWFLIFFDFCRKAEKHFASVVQLDKKVLFCSLFSAFTILIPTSFYFYNKHGYFGLWLAYFTWSFGDSLVKLVVIKHSLENK